MPRDNLERCLAGPPTLRSALELPHSADIEGSVSRQYVAAKQMAGVLPSKIGLGRGADADFGSTHPGLSRICFEGTGSTGTSLETTSERRGRFGFRITQVSITLPPLLDRTSLATISQRLTAIQVGWKFHVRGFRIK